MSDVKKQSGLSRILSAFSLGVAVLLCVRHTIAQTEPSIGQVLDGQLRPDREVSAFEHSDRLYPVTRVPRGAKTSTLPAGSTDAHALRFRSEGKLYDLFDYLAANRIAALLVIKDGRVVLEDYELGTTAQTRWPSFSMAKSVTSTLLGVALQQGLIGSLDESVTKYATSLRGSAYDAVSLRNLLQMASGVRWDETYTDPASDCRRLAAAQEGRQPGASIGFMRGLVRAAPAGSVWNYNSGEINIAGAVVEGATHTSLAAYLSRTLWAPLGMEDDATWWTEAPQGLVLGGVGLSATARDYARFGLFVANDGVVEGQRLVPAGWFAEAGRAHVIGGKPVDYGYLWWPLPGSEAIHAGAFEAKGIFGQRLYINPRENLVIVALSARSKPVGAPGLNDDAFFAAVAQALHTSR